MKKNGRFGYIAPKRFVFHYKSSQIFFSMAKVIFFTKKSIKPYEQRFATYSTTKRINFTDIEP